jgi:putative glutamine amidotransferase
MSEARPAIAICTALERARWSVWDLEAALLPFNYLTEIARAGGLPLMVPPTPELAEDPDQLLDRVDALVLAGGADIDPAAYGEKPHAETRGAVPARDGVEIALTRRAIERDLPVLGICRGMQLINVALGGTLHQHIPDLVGHHEHRRRPGTFDGADHEVLLQPGSLAARAAGEERHNTKSHHHQAVDRLGEGLRITGRSVPDELPEALEAPNRRFVLGVQWHPEADTSSRVIGVLVREASERRAALQPAA